LPLVALLTISRAAAFAVAKRKTESAGIESSPMSFMQRPATKSALLVVCGGLSGALAKSATAPLERVKIMAQAGQSSNFVKLLADIVRVEGWSGLWRGNTANVIRVIPNKGILLMCADMYKSAVQRALPSCGTAMISSVSGSLAGLTAVLATYPLELVRTRQAYRICDDLCLATTTISSTLRDVVSSRGLIGLYAGVGATLIGALPFEGLKFGAYDLLRSKLPTTEDGKTPPIWTVVAGATAGVFAHTLTYPLDTVRRRMQISGAMGAATYTSMLQCFQVIVRAEGYGTLFYGLLPTVIRSVPNLGIQFLLYEVLKSLLGFDVPQSPK